MGLGCLACPWAAARPRAVHAASFARRVGSKPGQAPPPPTGTAAWPSGPSGPSGALHTGDAWRAEVWLGAVPRSPARPRRRPSISHVIPLRLVQTLNLHRWNCNVFGVLWRVLLQTSSIRAAFCADFPALVTNVVNPTAFLRKIVVFGLRLTTFVTRVLTEGFKMRQFDDVCNASLPSAVSPCPVGDAVAADWGGSGGFAALGAGCRRVAGVSHL